MNSCNRTPSLALKFISLIRSSKLLTNPGLEASPNPFTTRGKPTSSKKALTEARILKEFSEKEIAIEEPDLRETPVVTYALLDDRAGIDSIFEPIVGFNENGEPCIQAKDYWRLLAKVRRSYYRDE
jgi:hypothetical protein